MKLLDCLDMIEAGGAGSGCDPAVAESHGTVCGPGKYAPGSGSGKYAHFGKAGSKKLMGVFVSGSAIANLFQHMMTGEWQHDAVLQTKMHEWGSTAKLDYRMTIMNMYGRDTGGWTVQKKKDHEAGGYQYRLVMTKATNQTAGQEGVKDSVQSAALKVVQQLISKEGLGATITASQFNQFMKASGLKTLDDVSRAVKSWTISSNGVGGQWMRRIACEYYGQSFSKEYSGKQTKNDMTEGKPIKSDIKEQMLAVKGLATEYARATGIKTLYRGFSSMPEDVVNQIWKAKKSGADFIEVPINSLSSWSTGKGTAGGFAGALTIKNSNVQPEDVWFTHKAMSHLFESHSSEHEWIVGTKGGSIRLPINHVWVNNKESQPAGW